MAEPVTLAEVKAEIRVIATDEDAKITAMIPPARLFVERKTGLILDQRQFAEQYTPEYGEIRLFKGPLVSVASVTYLFNGVTTTYVPRTFPPSTVILPASGGSWPSLSDGNKFTVTYTAGYAAGAVDPLLKAAVMTLIEGQYDEGFAYPARSVEAAERCWHELRPVSL